MGDFGNLETDPDGVARLHAIVPGLTLEDDLPSSLPGHVLVVHLASEEWTLPPGTLPGVRLACGVIERVHTIS